MWNSPVISSWSTTIYTVYQWPIKSIRKCIYHYVCWWYKRILEGETISETINIFNSELQKLNLWLAANKLTINVSKSHYMIFHRARMKMDNGPILLDGKPLEQLKFTKVLDMIIEDKLNFIKHITYIKNKLSKWMSILIKARQFVNRKSYLSTLLKLLHWNMG